MIYCKTCIMPSTRPEQHFKDGECDACRSTKMKSTSIDWEKRSKEFEKILSRYRGDGSSYDCLIPVSGGKDSFYTLHWILKFGLRLTRFHKVGISQIRQTDFTDLIMRITH